MHGLLHRWAVYGLRNVDGTSASVGDRAVLGDLRRDLFPPLDYSGGTDHAGRKSRTGSLTRRYRKIARARQKVARPWHHLADEGNLLHVGKQYVEQD